MRRYGPGILALAAVGYLALLSSHFLSGLSYIPMAILIGAFVSNTFGVHTALEKGVSTYELWLKAGIVLLGSQVAFTSLGLSWLKALPLAALIVGGSMWVVLLLGRALKLPINLAVLLAAGTGICGVSAIIRVAQVVNADDEDIEYAVGAILVLGAAAIVLYPIIGTLLGLPQDVYGLWAGLSVNNTAEAVATGYSYGQHAGTLAIAAKLCRVILLGFVVALLALRLRGKGQFSATDYIRASVGMLPKFVLLFFLVSILAGTSFISQQDQQTLSHISSWLFLLAFAGIGFKLRWENIRSVGVRPLVAVVLASVVMGGATLVASLGLARFVF